MTKKMKKHRYKNMMHCEDCFIKKTRKMWNEKPQPDYITVSPKRYKNIVKYGWVEGWFKDD